jgi:hypothetical protein
MPHTWVGSDFVNSVRAMFVYEEDNQLVLLAGVPHEWLAQEGVVIAGWPTFFGKLDLRAALTEAALAVELDGTAQPPGGYRLVLPDATPREVLIDGQPVSAVTSGSLALPPSTSRIVVKW